MAVNKDDLEVKIKVDSEEAKKNLENINESISKVAKNLEQLGGSVQIVNNSVTNFANSFNEMSKGVSGVGKTVTSVDSSMSSFKESIGRLSAGVIVANQALEILGKISSAVGGAILGSASKALELESAIAKINTITPKAERSQIALKEAIIEMSKAFGTDLESTAKAFYSAVDNNAIGAANAVSFVTEAQKLAAVTGHDLNSVTDGLGRVMLAYGINAGQAASVSNLFFVAMRDGSATFDDLIAATSQLSDMASEVGLSFEETTITLSALTDTGLSTSKAANALMQAISSLTNPTDELKLVIQSLGYESAEAMIGANGFATSLEMLSSKVGGSISSLGNLMGSGGLKGVSSLMQVVSGDARSSFDEMTKAIQSGAKDIDEAYRGIAETGKNEISKLSADFNASILKIGQSITQIFLPAMASVAKVVAVVFDRFASVDYAGLISSFKGLAIAIGGTAVAIELTSIAMGWGSIAFSGLTVSIWAAVTASAAFIAEWAPVAAIITGVVVAVDLLIANFNILLGKQKEFSGGFFGKLYTEMVGLFKGGSEAAKAAKEESDKLSLSLKKVGESAKSGTTSFDKIKEATEAIKSLKDMSKSYSDELSKLSLSNLVDQDSEMSRIESQKNYALAQVAAIEAQAKSAGLLTKQVSNDIDKIKGQIDKIAKLQIRSSSAKEVTEGLKATEASTEAVYKNLEEGRKNQSLFGKSVFEQIGIESAFKKKQIDDERKLYDLETARIKAKLDQAKAAGASTEELQKQQDLLAARGEGSAAIEQKKTIIGEEESQKMLTAGLNVGNSIVGAMSSGSEALASTMITQVGSMFGPVGEMVAGVINLFAKGPEFIKSMIDGFIQIVVNLPQMIIDGFFAFLDKIPEIAAALSQALIQVITMLLSLSFWVKLLKGIWTAVIQGVLAMLKGVVGAIKKMFGKNTGDVGKKITKGFVDGTKAGIKFLTGYHQKVFGVVEDIFKGKKGKGTLIGGIAAFGRKGGEEEKGRDAWWVAVRTWWSKLFVKLKNAFIKQTLRNLKMILPASWYEKIEASVDKLKSKLQEFNAWWATAIRRGNDAWSFNGMASRYHAWLKDIKKGWSDFSAWWKASIENAQAGWSLNGIQDRFTAWQTDWKKGWVDFTDWLKERFQAIFKPDVERGTVENWIEARISGFDIPWLKFAEGGMVPGRAKVKGDSSQNDTVPALLSAGEYILPRSVTQDKPLMKTILGLLKGGKAPAFALGGTVGNYFSKRLSIKGITTGAKQIGSDFLDFIKQPISGPLIGPSYGSTESFFSEIDLVEPLKSVWSFIKELGSGFSFPEFFKNPFGFLVSIIKDTIGGWVKPKVSGWFENAFSQFATGGLVGGQSFGDTIPAMLSSGEFVVNRRGVQSIGAANLGNLNLGRSMEFGGGETTINVNLEINTEQPIDGDFVRTKLVPALKKELKEASLRGEFLISGKGIR